MVREFRVGNKITSQEGGERGEGRICKIRHRQHPATVARSSLVGRQRRVSWPQLHRIASNGISNRTKQSEIKMVFVLNLASKEQCPVLTLCCKCPFVRWAGLYSTDHGRGKIISRHQSRNRGERPRHCSHSLELGATVLGAVLDNAGTSANAKRPHSTLLVN